MQRSSIALSFAEDSSNTFDLANHISQSHPHIFPLSASNNQSVTSATSGYAQTPVAKTLDLGSLFVRWTIGHLPNILDLYFWTSGEQKHLRIKTHDQVLPDPSVSIINEDDLISIHFVTGSDLSVFNLVFPMDYSPSSFKQALKVASICCIEDLPPWPATNAFQVSPRSFAIVLFSGQVYSLDMPQGTDSLISSNSRLFKVQAGSLVQYKSDSSLWASIPKNVLSFGQKTTESSNSKCIVLGNLCFIICATISSIKFWDIRSRSCVKSTNFFDATKQKSESQMAPIFTIFNVTASEEEVNAFLAVLAQEGSDYRFLVYNIRIANGKVEDLIQITTLPVSCPDIDFSKYYPIDLFCCPEDLYSGQLVLTIWKNRKNNSTKIANSLFNVNEMSWELILKDASIFRPASTCDISFSRLSNVLLGNELNGHFVVSCSSEIDLLASHVTNTCDLKLVLFNSPEKIRSLDINLCEALKLAFDSLVLKLDKILGVFSATWQKASLLKTENLLLLVEMLTPNTLLLELSRCCRIESLETSILLVEQDNQADVSICADEKLPLFFHYISDGLIKCMLEKKIIAQAKRLSEEVESLKFARRIAQLLAKYGSLLCSLEKSCLLDFSPKALSAVLRKFVSKHSVDSSLKNLICLSRNAQNTLSLLVPKHGPYLYIWALDFLSKFEYSRADQMFKRFGHYLESSPDAFTPSLSAIIGSSLGDYYLHVSTLFSEKAAFSESLSAAKLAQTYGNKKAKIFLFSFSMELARFDEAYFALMDFADEKEEFETRLTHFVTSLLEINPSSLVNRYTFFGFEFDLYSCISLDILCFLDVFTSGLESKAFSSNQGVICKILYSLYCKKKDFKSAALWMYKLSQQHDVGPQEQAKALVAVVSIISTLSEIDQWIVTEGKVLTLNDLRAMYVVKLARLEMGIYLPDMEIPLKMKTEDMFSICLKNERLIERAITLYDLQPNSFRIPPLDQMES